MDPIMTDAGDFVLLSNGRYVKLPKSQATLEPNVQKETRPMLERVNNVWGSTAGAGSDFFHIYRKHRAHEMERLRQLDEDYEREQEEKEFQLRRLQQFQRTAARSQTKSLKRKRRKKNAPKKSPASCSLENPTPNITSPQNASPTLKDNSIQQSM